MTLPFPQAPLIFSLVIPVALPPSDSSLTELIEDMQQLMGHDAASSAKVHGSKEKKSHCT